MRLSAMRPLVILPVGCDSFHNVSLLETTHAVTYHSFLASSSFAPLPCSERTECPHSSAMVIDGFSSYHPDDCACIAMGTLSIERRGLLLQHIPKFCHIFLFFFTTCLKSDHVYFEVTSHNFV